MSTKLEANSRDWFLISIVGGILVLIIISFIFALRGPDPLEYRTGSGPEDVALNYFIALQLGEYEQAYNLLSTDLPNRPETTGQFFDDVQGLSDWECRIGDDNRSDFAVDSIDSFEDSSLVRIEETYAFDEPSLFGGSGVSMQTVEVRLTQTDAGWQIANSDRCWDWTWSEVATGDG